MSRDDADMPQRLRVSGATELERRLLEATAQEEPSPELQERMAKAIGVSTVALGAAAGAKLGAAATASKSAAGSSYLVPWISAGVLTLAVAGAIILTRGGPPAAPQVPPVSSPVNVQAPVPAAPTAPVGVLPVSAVESSISAKTPVRRRQSATAANDLRDQIALVDAARAAVAVGSGDRALEILRHYQDEHPAGSFRPEAAALKIEALVKLGRKAEGRALAERFVADHGKTPLADRVARIAGIAQP